MRITILAIGTRGDVQPCIALGHGLRSAGHQVSLAAFSDFDRFVSDEGLTYVPIRGSMSDLVQTEMAQEIAKSGTNLVKATRLMASILETLTSRFCVDLLNACRGADIVIFSTAAPHGYHLYAIPESLGIPCIAAYLFPMFGYTRDFPHPLWPFDLHLGGIGSALSNTVVQQLIWQPFRKTINRWRRDVLSLPPVPFQGPYDTLHERPILYGYSPSVIPPPAQPISWAHVTGFWFLDSSPFWRPSQALTDFLASGPPPVYIGFGSVNSAEAQQVMHVARKTLDRIRSRAVLLAGSTSLPGRISDNLFVTDPVPFDWLFPRMSAVVHHGGAGTTAAALRAGVPSVVVPFKGEQFFFGRLAAKLGAGAMPISRNKLTPETLGQAIRFVTSDPNVKRRATQLGRKIQREDGVGEAVRVFEELAMGRGIAAARLNVRAAAGD
jgi:UDP:flavonoid glycosyltransferase YjiC (YdhE family)